MNLKTYAIYLASLISGYCFTIGIKWLRYENGSSLAINDK